MSNLENSSGGQDSALLVSSGVQDGCSVQCSPGVQCRELQCTVYTGVNNVEITDVQHLDITDVYNV